MISPFGIEHGYDEISKASRSDKERAQHYGRMSAAMGTLGGTAAAVGTGSGIVGHLEHKGKDPMGFTTRSLDEWDRKPMSGVVRANVLKPVARLHTGQMKAGYTAGALGGALALGYHHKKKKLLQQKKQGVSKAQKRSKADRAGGAALGVGSAALGGAALKEGMHVNHFMGASAKDWGKEARGAHHVLAGNKLGAIQITGNDAERELAHARKLRRVGARSAAVKGLGAKGGALTAVAGGAGLFELGRYNMRRKKSQ